MSGDLERWRLVLGSPADEGCGTLTGDAARADAALDWLYGRDPGLAERGIRSNMPAARGRDGGGRDKEGGYGDSVLTPVDWLEEIHTLFPRATVERLERDAVERYGIEEIVTDPELLARVEPNPALLKAVLRTKHLMNPDVLALARQIVSEVVRRLTERLRTEMRRSHTGRRAQRPSPFGRSGDLDVPATLRANLRHYRPAERRVLIESPRFRPRHRARLTPWQLILLVDQSGSMLGSVIHSAVTAACLWELPGLRPHLVAFDTQVVDLTADVVDPVELLMKVQLGGGTDIHRAVTYAASLVDNPRRTIVAVVSDFYEAGDGAPLVHAVRRLAGDGVQVLALAALDEDARPDFDTVMGRRLAGVGAHVGAMTPGELVEFVAERLGG